MPIQPSPSYHGYDITNYEAVNPQYGSMADFQRLVAAAHQRHIKVILDLVANHTSSQHPWFIAAQNDASPYHAWYNWATPRTNLRAISAAGGPAWHKDADGQYYLGVFTAEMPDLNYDNPAVRQAMIDVGRFWLAKGVDGFRLDAAQHIYFDLESEKNDPAILAKNIAWWSAFRQGIDGVNPHAYLVGEVTRDSPDQLAPYFKPLDAAFDFPLAKQLIASARTERAGKLPALLERTQADYFQVTGKYGVDAPFLSNHDQERVMSQLDGNAAHMRVAAAMLLTLPGQPYVYYGEELGTRGMKPDPDLREPMRWHRDDHGPGETHWKPFSAYDDDPAVSVDAETADPHSLLNLYRTLIGWRRQIAPLRDGKLTAQKLGQPSLAAWELADADGAVLVVHNLSGHALKLRLPQALSRFASIERQTGAGATLADGRLALPAYDSVILR